MRTVHGCVRVRAAVCECGHVLTCDNVCVPGRKLPKVITVAKARSYGMLVAYGVGNRRVVNRPSKSLHRSGQPLVLTIPNCSPWTWMQWLRDNPSSLLLTALPHRYAGVATPRPVTNPEPSPRRSPSVRTPSPAANLRTPSPSAQPTIRTPSPRASVRTPSPAVSVRTPSPNTVLRRQDYLDQLVSLTQSSGLSPEEVEHVLAALTGVEEHPTSPSRTPQERPLRCTATCRLGRCEQGIADFL